MPNKLAKTFLFSFVLFVGVVFLFLPDFAFAGGEYQAYLVPKTGDTNINQLEYLLVKYDGFVPCGKCLQIKELYVLNGGNVTKGNLNQVREKIRTCSKYLSYETEDRCKNMTEYVYLNCEFCHFFVMINQAISFLLIKLIPPLALLMLVIGGVMFYLGGAKPDMLSRAKKLMVGVAIGLFLVYGAYMIIGVFLMVLDMADFSSFSEVYKNGVFTINCPIRIQCQ